MLPFTTSLTNALSKTATQSYWLLRLYFNDESEFTGISDRTRTIGGVIYYGLANWGNHNQTLNIDQFTTSNGTMQVSLDNSPNKINGGRFSDLLSTNNYSKRKWERFQCDENADFSEDNLIAGGIISSDFKPTPNSIDVYLNDYWAKYNIELPTNKVTKALYPNAPEKNLDSPIPMAYGDCSAKTSEDGFRSHLVKGRFPAIITDKWNAVDSITQAKPDNESVQSLSIYNLFMYNKKYFACEPLNVDVTAATPILAFTSNKWTDYHPLVKWDTYEDTNYGNTIDQDPSTSYNLDATSGPPSVAVGWRVPIPFNKAGTIEDDAPDSHTIKIWILTGTKTGTAPSAAVLSGYDFVYNAGQDFALNWALDAEGIDITGQFTEAQQASWDLQQASNDRWVLVIDDSVGGNWDQTVPVIEVAYIIEFTADKAFEQTITVKDRPLLVGNMVGHYGVIERYKDVDVWGTDLGEYIYWSGKGRNFGAWIDADSRNQGYASGGLLESSTFIIEDIARTELGLTSANIRYVYFDAAGDTDTGDILDTFNENVATDIKFAFSNYKSIFARKLIDKICQQSGQYVWWSGVTLAIKARRRTYTSADSTIDFKDIKNPTWKLSSMEDVFNHISVDYDFDYGANKTIKSSTPDDNASQEDSTSQGTTVNGYGEVLKLTANMPFTLDQTTAENYGDALLAWYKDRKQIITFDTKDGTSRYNALEVGDIINFDNWDANLKINGDTITTADGFMITQITKSVDSLKITVTEVAGTIS